ncbi:MAG: WYL domain-containing protein [Planctomycetota bacterium]
MRTKRVERLLRLIQSLQAGRQRTVDEISKAVGVSRRTVFRDLEMLSRAGIVFTFDRDTQRYSAGESTLLPPVSLTHSEALAVLLAMRFSFVRQLIPDADAAASAGLKIESLIPATLRDHCGRLLNRMRIFPQPASDAAPIGDSLLLVQQALARQVKIKVRYDSYYDRKVLDLILHPYHLIYIHRGWYLIAFSELHTQVRTFKVERLLQSRSLDVGFRIQPTFNIDQYFGNAWLMIRGDRLFHVKILFSPKVAANVDEIAWHKTQRSSYQDDGSLLFEVDVEGIQEIIWWILGYGEHAVVLEPLELREAMIQHVRRLAETYLDRDQNGK